MSDLNQFFLEPADEHPISFNLCDEELIQFPLHYHPMIEVVICFDGNLNLINGETSHMLQKNDIALISPLAIHGYDANTAQSNITILFDENLYMDLENASLFTSNQQIILLRHLSNDQIDLLNDCLQHIAFYYGTQDVPLLSFYCKIFLTHLFRFIIADKSIQTIEDLYSSPHIKNILTFVQANYREQITLDHLAEHLKINRFTISKLINRHLDCTLSDLINQYRLLDACQLLVASSLSILEISELVGYGSINSLNRNFIRRFNITPNEFRKQKKFPSTFLAHPTKEQ